jgi:hypothetical protein
VLAIPSHQPVISVHGLDVGRYLSYGWCQSVSASASSPARAMGAERENGGSRRRDSLGGGELSVCIIGDVHHR